MLYNKKRIRQNVFSDPWYKNIRNIPLYFRRIRFFNKRGYDEAATWETFDWFIQTMRDILSEYRKKHYGYIVIDSEKSDEWNETTWNDIIDKMISLLDDMDEFNENYEDEYNSVKAAQKMNSAKDEFFELFSKYFYALWD